MPIRLADFRNEPYADFSDPANAAAMRDALALVRSQFGREYPIRIGQECHQTESLLDSLNPSHPNEIVGRHHKASASLATDAVTSANSYFHVWAATSPSARVEMLRRAANILRRRKFEFNAWLVCEAGKSWAEAEADVSEAIDFCDYYALLILRLEHP